MSECAGQRLIGKRIERGVKRADARARRKHDPNRKRTPQELARSFQENILKTMSTDRNKVEVIDLKRRLYLALYKMMPDKLTLAEIAIMHELASDDDIQRIFEEARDKPSS